MNEVFFTSDLHLGHKMMASKFRVPRLGEVTLEEHDQTIVDNYNSVVSKGDLVYWLGDISFHKRERTAELLDQMNGQKYLILGNHDGEMKPQVIKDRFVTVDKYKEIKVGEQRIVLFHFPILSWHQVNYGSWHLHGHCHGNLPQHPTLAILDVGVDNHPEFRPFSYEEVAAHMEGRDGRPQDHHGPDMREGT